MKIVGYHNTESDNVDDIIANGFVCKKNEKHWLGQGIYFFNDADTAFRNIDMLDHEKDIKTIIAEINIACRRSVFYIHRRNLPELHFCIYRKQVRSMHWRRIPRIESIWLRICSFR